ncbi:AEC family transporter [Cohnella fermenti]|uniref:AEC family transporter n=1 Tax=Cohnella fermenti TaxID=2565925 RepID=A0A4S4BKB3_9BACL|nr:AEC family transporter [Cohnella fermenti]THF75154.1 AEC family transporter [Cohnella fermenti]
MLHSIVSTLLQVIVPLSIPVIVGALLRRFKNLDTKPLSVLYLYFLSPAILLETLTTATITTEDAASTVAFCLINLALLWLVATVVGKLLKLPAPEKAGLTLISTLTNSVNYGLPLVLLAFGQLGLDKASLYVVVQIVLTNTIGVFFAARSQFSFADAVRSIFKLPAIYAAIFAFLLRAFELSLPDGLQSGIALSSGAYSPVVLTILGAQMISVGSQAAGRTKIETRTFWTGMAIRTFAAPLIAALIIWALGVEGTAAHVFFILASMPVAVNAVVLAERFDAAPKLLSRCILWSTLSSFVWLPVLIGFVS